MTTTGKTRGSSCLVSLTLLLATLIGLSTAAPAGAVRRSFPASWVNPASNGAAFEDWDFGRCTGSYIAGQAHLGADSQGFKTGPVRSIASGIVRQKVWWGSGWGYAVAVEHSTTAGGRFLAVYGHISPSVAVGNTVAAGQTIATLYPLGTNTHLHLGIRPLGTAENAATAPVRGTGTCSNARGYVDPLPWLAGQQPAGSGTSTTSNMPQGTAGRWATVRTWSPPWNVRTFTGPSRSNARIGSLNDGQRVLIACQQRNGQPIRDYYGPSNRTITWSVWNRTTDGQWFPDLYSDLPANPGLPNC